MLSCGKTCVAICDTRSERAATHLGQDTLIMNRLMTVFAGIAAVTVVAMPAMSTASTTPIHVNAPSPDTAVRTFKVSYADLNLQHEEGVSRLKTRVKMAVKQVCAPMTEQDLAELSSSRSCAQKSMDRAMTDVSYAVATVNSGQRIANRAPGELQVSSR